MVFTNPWDESDPPGGQDANTADTEIQQVKVDVRERIETILPGWTDDLEDPKLFPGWLLQKANTFSLASSTLDIVDWTVEIRDTDAFIAVTAQNVVIPAGLGGLYIVGATMGWAIGAVGRREFELEVNAAVVDTDRRNPITGITTYQELSQLLDLSDADSVRLTVFHTQGAALLYGNVDATPELVTFWGIRLGGF